MAADSISLEDFARGRAPAGPGCSAALDFGGFRALLMLFILFLFVSSDFFIGNFAAKLGAKFVRGRDLTAAGTLVQGVCLVLLFAGLSALSASGIIF